MSGSPKGPCLVCRHLLIYHLYIILSLFSSLSSTLPRLPPPNPVSLFLSPSFFLLVPQTSRQKHAGLLLYAGWVLKERERGSVAVLALANQAEGQAGSSGLGEELRSSTPPFPRHPPSVYGYTKCLPLCRCCQGSIISKCQSVI